MHIFLRTIFFSGFLLCVCVSTSARIQCRRTLCKALGNAQLACELHARRPTMSPKKRLGRGHRKSLACAHWTHGVAHRSSHPKVGDWAHNNPPTLLPTLEGHFSQTVEAAAAVPPLNLQHPPCPPWGIWRCCRVFVGTLSTHCRICPGEHTAPRGGEPQGAGIRSQEGCHHQMQEEENISEAHSLRSSLVGHRLEQASPWSHYTLHTHTHRHTHTHTHTRTHTHTHAQAGLLHGIQATRKAANGAFKALLLFF